MTENDVTCPEVTKSDSRVTLLTLSDLQVAVGCFSSHRL